MLCDSFTVIFANVQKYFKNFHIFGYIIKFKLSVSLIDKVYGKIYTQRKILSKGVNYKCYQVNSKNKAEKKTVRLTRCIPPDGSGCINTPHGGRSRRMEIAGIKNACR